MGTEPGRNVEGRLPELWRHISRIGPEPPLLPADHTDRHFENLAQRLGSSSTAEELTPSAPGQPGALFPHAEADELAAKARAIASHAVLLAQERRERALTRYFDRLWWSCGFCVAHAPGRCSFHSALDSSNEEGVIS